MRRCVTAASWALSFHEVRSVRVHSNAVNRAISLRHKKLDLNQSLGLESLINLMPAATYRSALDIDPGEIEDTSNSLIRKVIARQDSISVEQRPTKWRISKTANRVS